jgi:hypothetical protein
MAKVKFHILSQTELALDEDAKKGDIIDLTEEQNIDLSIVADKVQEIVATANEKAQAEWQKQQDVITKEKLATEKAQTEVKYKEDLAKRDAELAELKARLEGLSKTAEADLKVRLAEKEAEKQQALAAREQQITELKAAAEKQAVEKDAEKQRALAERERQVTELEGQLKIKDQEKTLAENAVKQKYQIQLQQANEQVEFYKDFKARQSTKEIGESLEQYALNEFNKIRMTAFPNAYFEKDNELSATNSKGDFIFRDYQDGTEFISIMFDMKNEADTTATKHKNTDFFKELNKDRREKGTEYAVLVSMLEADSDYYNTGIVQVYEYEKMYVIRPQFFIQFIGLLRNSALNAVGYQQELKAMQEQNIDVTNFEGELAKFKESFGVTAKNFNGNLEKLDKSLEDSIKKLSTARDELRKAMKNLGTAENKVEEVSVKRLTRNNPTMAAKFDELREG